MKLTRQELAVIEEHLGQLEQPMAALLPSIKKRSTASAEVQGLRVDSAPQIIAEVGATAATFLSAKHLVS